MENYFSAKFVKVSDPVNTDELHRVNLRTVCSLMSSQEKLRVLYCHVHLVAMVIYHKLFLDIVRSAPPDNGTISVAWMFSKRLKSLLSVLCLDSNRLCW